MSSSITRGIQSVGAISAITIGLIVGLAGCGSPVQSPTNAPRAQATEVNPAGDIPDNQAFVAVTGDSGTYSIKVPEGWARTSTGSTSMTFTDKLNSISADSSSVSAAPTVDSVKTTLVPSLESSRTKFQLGDVKTFTRPGGSGVVVRYLMDSAPNAVTGKVERDQADAYVFWKNGEQVILTVSGPQGADNVDPWNVVTGSFTWVR
jgi:hypothetical protein